MFKGQLCLASWFTPWLRFHLNIKWLSSNNFLFELFLCVCYVRGIQFHSFAYGYSVFPTLSFEDNILSPCCILGTLPKMHWVYNNKLISEFFSVLLVYVCIFMPVLYHFNYYNFVVYFEIKKYAASSFVLLYQICFGYLVSLIISHEF